VQQQPLHQSLLSDNQAMAQQQSALVNSLQQSVASIRPTSNALLNSRSHGGGGPSLSPNPQPSQTSQLNMMVQQQHQHNLMLNQQLMVANGSPQNSLFRSNSAVVGSASKLNNALNVFGGGNLANSVNSNSSGPSVHPQIMHHQHQQLQMQPVASIRPDMQPKIPPYNSANNSNNRISSQVSSFNFCQVSHV
jgi:hypothetical protein